MNHRRSCRAAAILSALILPLSASANPYEKTLPNGLRVIVQEDRRAPTAVHMVWYRAGSMDEVDGTSGVAHVLEHMMFKGTRTLKAGEFNKRVAAAGGRDNAFTSLDYTAYFQQVPARRLGEMMALEADRMANLILDAREFEQEIKVVMEERRLRTDDNPQSLLHEKQMAAAFQAHPYRRPVVGWMSDLENMTAADARDWYRRWYAPNNAYLIVVGDVRKDDVFRLAERHYGRIPARALPGRKPQNEPAQVGIKRISVKAPARLPHLSLAWKVPALRDLHRDREPYALEMLASLLDGHEAARLAKSLVRGAKVAVAAGAGYDAAVRGEALFVVSGTPAAGRSVAELEAALRGEIERVASGGIEPEELERVRMQLIAAQVYKRDSMMAQAMEIGRMEAAGVHWRDLDALLERIRGVTAAEVQAVAKKYFGDDTLTVAVLDPQPLADGAAKGPTAAVRH